MRLATIAVSLALLTQPGSAIAQGGVDLTWDNCVLPDVDAGEPAPSIDELFDCSTPQVYKLYGCFKTPVYMPTFHALDIVIDIYYKYDQPLEPFWHFETGGCNEDWLMLSASRAGSGGCRLFVSPWGVIGTYSEIAAYYPDHERPGLGRLLAYITRVPDDPFPLHAGINYYAFTLYWYTYAAGQCAGCNEVMTIVLNHATLRQSWPDPDIILFGPDKGTAYYASINADYPVSVGPITWGQIKSQYR